MYKTSDTLFPFSRRGFPFIYILARPNFLISGPDGRRAFLCRTPHDRRRAAVFLRLDTAMTSPLYLNLDMDTATSSPLYVQPPETISVKVFNADYLEPFAIYATFDTAQRNTRLAARSRREGRVQYVNDVDVARLDAPFGGDLTTCPEIPLRRGRCGYFNFGVPD